MGWRGWGYSLWRGERIQGSQDRSLEIPIEQLCLPCIQQDDLDDIEGVDFGDIARGGVVNLGKGIEFEEGRVQEILVAGDYRQDGIWQCCGSTKNGDCICLDGSDFVLQRVSG